MIGIETIGTKVAMSLISTGIIKGFNKVAELLGSPLNDYEKELANVIDDTITEYKRLQPARATEKTHFIDSQAIITELLRFRLTEKIDEAELKKRLRRDERLEPPTDGEISLFLTVFSEVLSKATNLAKLNIEFNHKEEIFRISAQISTVIQETLPEIFRLVADVKDHLVQNNQVSAVVVKLWSHDLDQIRQFIETFRPKSALDLLNSLRSKIQNEGIAIDGAFEGKLKYLQGLCMSELSIDSDGKEYAPLFIDASRLCPTNMEFKARAGFALYTLGENSEAESKAMEILNLEGYNVSGWLILGFLKGSEFVKFLGEIPLPVREKRDFKLNAVNWLFSKNFISKVGQAAELGLELDVETETEPSAITFSNKGLYSRVMVPYLLNRVYEKHSLVGVAGPSPSLLKDGAFKLLHGIVRKIVAAVDNSEISHIYAWHRFLLLYSDFFSRPQKDGDVAEISKAFEALKNKTHNEIVMMVQVYNSTRNADNQRKGVALIENTGEEMHEMLMVFGAYSLLLLGDTKASALIFRKFISAKSPLDDDSFINTIRYLEALRGDDKESHIELVQEMRTAVFEEERHFEMLSLYFPTSELKESGAENIESKMDALVEAFPNSDRSSREFVALILFNWGFVDKTIEYLKDVVDTGRPTLELTIYCKACYNGKADRIQLLETLRQCNKTNHIYFDLYSMEITLRQKLDEYAEIAAICEVALKMFPTNERLLRMLFYALDRENDVDGVVRNATLLDGKVFEDESTGLAIAQVLLRCGLSEQSMGILYNICSKTANIEFRQHYFTASVAYPPSVYKSYSTPSIGTFVKYEVADKTHIMQITEGNRDSEPFKSLLGKTPGQSFMFQRNGKLLTGKVLRVMDKYLALFERVMLEAEDPGAGYTMVSIKLEGEFNLETFHKKLVEQFGIEGAETNITRDKKLQDYYNGHISFSEVSAGVFNKDCINAYYHLSSGTKAFKAIPAIIGHPVLNSSTRFIIDFTSLCLFYEIQQAFGLEYPSKFIISKHVLHHISKLRGEAVSMPDEGVSLDVSTSGVKGHSYGRDYAKGRREFLANLESWCQRNCESDSVKEKLNFFTDPNAEITKDDYVMYLADNRLLVERENHILLTNDIMYLRTASGDSNRVVSPEIYLTIQFPDKANEFKKFLVSRNYCGITVSKEILQDEFMNMLGGKENRYSICIENLNLLWNPDLGLINNGVQFLKWLFLENYIQPNLKQRHAFLVILKLLRHANANQIRYLRNNIVASFTLMGSAFDEIMEIFETALTSLKKG